MDYRVWSDKGTIVNFYILSDTVTTLEYAFTDVVQGTSYQFFVQARNAYGYSVFSQFVFILAAQVPDQPAQPTTVWSPDDVIVSWTEPDSGGSPLTGYTVLFIQHDGAYSSEPTNCDMTSSLLTTCTVPVLALKSEPFSLDWGSSVFVKVIATNGYGSSE